MKLIRTVMIMTYLIGLASFLRGSDSITVYIFMLDECRICQETAPELNRIYNEFGQKIGFLGLFPNFSSKPKGIQAFKNKYDIQFKTKTDYYKTLTKKFDASVLPEVVVYNETKNTILYRGAINDLFYSQGKRRHFVQHHYLHNALTAIIQGQLPVVKETKPTGCFINFNDSLKSIN